MQIHDEANAGVNIFGAGKSVFHANLDFSALVEYSDTLAEDIISAYTSVGESHVPGQQLGFEVCLNRPDAYLQPLVDISSTQADAIRTAISNSRLESAISGCQLLKQTFADTLDQLAAIG